jgi:outer membrane protein TolC
MRQTLCTFLFLLLISGSSVAQQSFSLQQAIDYAMENSFDMKDARYNTEFSKKQALEAISYGLPKLDANVDYVYNYELPVSILPGDFVGQPGQNVALEFGLPNNMDIGADLTQLVFDMRYFIGLKATGAIKDQGFAREELSEIEIRQEVTKAYYLVLITGRSYEILTDNRESLQKIYDETKAQYEAGFVQELDVDRLELQLANLITTIQNTELLLANANLNLKYVMNYPMEDEITLTEDLESAILGLTTDTEEKIKGFVAEKRKEYEILQLQEELKTYDFQQKRTGFYPTLVAFANYRVNAQREKFNFTNDGQWFDVGQVGFSLNIPIFNGLNTKAITDQAKIGALQAKNDLEKFASSANLQVQTANNSYLNAYRNFENQRANLELAQKILDKSRIMYQEGVGSSLELSQAESDFIRTQNNFLTSVYELALAYIDLQVALGEYNN